VTAGAGRSRDPRVLAALTAWAACNLAGIVVLLRVIGDFSAVVRPPPRLVLPFLTAAVVRPPPRAY
jgi:hypothetical protein